MDDRLGQQFGPYRLTRLLGKGGFANVYLAEHIYLKTQAAIKVLYARLNPEAMENFLAEARHLSRLVHPRITRLLDFNVEGEVPFLIMEYAPGGSLRDLHPPGKPLPLSLVVSYVKQIAEALQYAHEYKVIHRDLKPENLLLGSENKILLGDFGIAQTINSAQYMNVAALSGTLFYMAPEQLHGKPQIESDQYSLGVIAYEWLNGKRPFEGTLSEIFGQHLIKLPASLCEKVPDLPLAVEEVIFHALEKEPGKRFPDVRAFAQALEHASQPGYVGHLSILPSEVETDGGKISIATEKQEQIRFNNLPAQLTSFLGREEVRKAAGVLIVRPEVRLLTLVGAGGIGKTRLALSLADGIQQTFTHGVCFVSLAPLNNPDQVLPAIALALGLPEQGQVTPATRLKQFLRNKHLLLVLDNFEHITAAAPQLIDLLLTCHQLKMLITSRAVLHSSGEQIFLVPPMDLPDLTQDLSYEAIVECEAVKLFVERARAVIPDFQLSNEHVRTVAEICARLDGLPLAIELAAARSTLLTPPSLLARLKRRLLVLTSQRYDLPARLQTLRNTIKWSYDLLSWEEQRLFCRLAIFVDGCRLEAIEELYTLLGEDPGQVLDGVASLLDKSLLQQKKGRDGEARAVMLETLREFGLENLTEAGELERCQLAHASYYQSYVKQLSATRQIGLFQAPVEKLEADYANIRTTLQGLMARQESNDALYLATTLSSFWGLRGTVSEGRAFLEQAIEQYQTGEHKGRKSNLPAFASMWAGMMAHWQGDFGSARKLLGSALNIHQELGHTSGYGMALIWLGMAEIEQKGGDFRAGEAMMKKGIEIAREVDMSAFAHALTLRAIHYLHRGNLIQAKALCEESLTLYSAQGSAWFNATTIHCLGWVTFLEGDTTRALHLTEEALALYRTLGAPPFFEEALVLCAFEHLALGNETQASTLFEEALIIGQRQGNNEYIIRALCGLGRLSWLQGDQNRARRCFEESAQIMENMPYAERRHWVLATCLEGLGIIALKEKQPIWATRLFAAADTRRRLLGSYSSLGLDQKAYEQAISEARSALREADFTRAWEEGSHLSPVKALHAQEPPTRAPVSAPPPKKLPVEPSAAKALGLTRREMDVLLLLGKGMTNAQIAEHLVLSIVTVNSYLRSIYSKLGVTSRTQAIRFALDHHLLK